MTDLTEEWRTIDGFEGLYEICIDGRVRSWKTPGNRGRSESPREIVIKTDRINRRYVTLYERRVSHNRFIHTLIMACFVGPRPSGLEICHYNGDSTDNRVENLRYDTHVANMADRDRHGRTQLCGLVRLNESQVREIRSARADGTPVKILAAQYGVVEPTISRIATGARWAHLV